MVSLGVWWPKAIIDKPIVRDWNVREWQRRDSGVAVAERGRSYKSKSTPIMIYNEVIDCWNHHCRFGQGDGTELVKSTLMAPWLFLPESESKVAQSRPTLWDPMDCNLAGSSIHGVFQARILQWVAIFPSQWLNRVSRIAGRLFTVWDTGEAKRREYSLFFFAAVRRKESKVSVKR